MTKENEKLRDCLRDAESIITNALRSQPEGDNECKIHLTKAVKDVLGLVYEAKSQMPDGSKYAMEGMGHPSAHDRPSNTAAMREALEKASLFLHKHNMGTVCLPDGSILPCWKVAEIVDAALAAPPRNCDAGTQEEQYKRFRDYCFRKRCESLITPNTLGSEVAFAWAQMPYDEGVAE